MSRELLESKLQNDYFAGNDDTYSSLKHEFSRIFHENNLHSFANASDIGFLNVEKLGSHGIADNTYEESYQQQSYQPYQNYQGYQSYGYAPQQKGSNSPFLTRLNSDSNPIYSQSPMTYGQNQGPSVTYSTAANKQVPVPGSPSYYYQGYQYQNYGQAESPYLDYSTPTTGSYPSGQGYDEYIAHELIDSHPNNALGLMWSNNAAKNTTESQQLKEEKAAYKVEQEFGSISNKKLSQQMDKAKAGESSAGLRRTTRVNTKISYNTIGKDDDDLESGSDDDKEDAYGESKGRRSRGLRVLSLKVREIVSKRDRTSYKEVADALLEDLAQKMKGRPQSEIAKEEQNVKRRVYDALNVLIAAEILEKDGKQVSLSNTRPVNSGGSQKKKSKGGPDRESLIEMIEAAKQRKQEKQDALQELVFKNLAVKNLIKKNKAKEEAETNALSNQGLGIRRGVSQATRIDVVEENASLKQQSQDNISFPFIVIVSGSAENSMNINMDASQKQLSIDSRKAFDIYGDIDVLLKMKLHYVSKSMFESEVSKPLRKYISPQFINELGK